jgi:hypothetical protein
MCWKEAILYTADRYVLYNFYFQIINLLIAILYEANEINTSYREVCLFMFVPLHISCAVPMSQAAGRRPLIAETIVQ